MREASRDKTSGQLPKILDAVDLLILEKMLDDGSVTFKELAEMAKTDYRTIASHFSRLKKSGIIRKITIDVDWARLGLRAVAFVGTRTSHGETEREKLFQFIKHQPRVLDAYTTIGSHEYFVTICDTDISRLRSEICDPLEPMTSGLATSVVIKRIKEPDYHGLLRTLRREPEIPQ